MVFIVFMHFLKDILKHILLIVYNHFIAFVMKMNNDF